MLAQTKEPQLERKKKIDAALKDICEQQGITCEYKRKQIRQGIRKGLPYKIYAKDIFQAPQMTEIRMALESRVPFTKFADPKYSWEEMREIRRALEEGFPVKEWSDRLPLEEMMALVDGMQGKNYLASIAGKIKKASRNVENAREILESIGAIETMEVLDGKKKTRRRPKQARKL